MDHWISVYETDLLYRAELTKDILNNEEVDAVILNRKDSSYHSAVFRSWFLRKTGKKQQKS